MRVVIGRFGRPHGVHGEIAVDVRTDEPQRRFSAGAQAICGEHSFTITGMRRHGSRILVRLDGVDNRDEAEDLAGSLVETDVDPGELPDDADEFYDYQLRGLTVVSRSERIGRVSDIMHGTLQDTLVINVHRGADSANPDAAGPQVLVPFVAGVVSRVDIRAGELHIHNHEDLLSLNVADDAES